jgi:flagella basal body P-ring formation protein FlgA
MIATLALALVTLASTAPDAAEVRLRPTASCSSPIVRLTDIADVVAGDPRLAQALADIALCPAPNVGTERTLTQHDVRQLLAWSGVERGDCRVCGSEAVTLTVETALAATTGKRPFLATGVRQALFTDAQDATRVAVRPAAAMQSTPLPKPPAAAPLVERGGSVTVIAKAAGIRITAAGKALETGREGDTVNVELADSKQRVLGRVSGPQTVELAASGLP